MMVEDNDPVFEKDGEWYFWDETWSNDYGPFATEEAARRELEDYCHWLDTGHTGPREDCAECQFVDEATRRDNGKV